MCGYLKSNHQLPLALLYTTRSNTRVGSPKHLSLAQITHCGVRMQLEW